MPLLTLRRVVLTLGHPPLFSDVSFAIERGERVCLVGRNGAGKSTLLRMIAGEIPPDDGSIERAQNLRIARLEQEVPRDATGSVYHVVAGGLERLGEWLERYHELTHAMADGDYSHLSELEQCQQQIEAAGGWTLSQRVDTAITRLQLDPDADIAQLSGGMKRRVMLARALVSEPDLLLLDEPTNHLDIDAIRWLEEFFLTWNGTLLFITHDRAFVQRLATRIVELDRGRVFEFPGDYETYLNRKEAMLADEDKHNALFDKRLAQEEAWIRQGVKARRTRAQGRVTALMKMREERAERRTRLGSAAMTLNEADRSGKIVAEAEHVDFAWDGRMIVRDLNTLIQRGDKIGIIGPNGCGKTTLLRLLLGELQPTRGTLKHGTKLEVSYFDQYRSVLDLEQTVQHNVGQGSDMVDTGGTRKHVLSYLQDFLFTPDRARQPVKALSGGERNRLLLAKLFLKPCNVLVMDEPTNDLDSDTLELLEELLANYSGTLLLVSHDRAFLDNVVTGSLVFEGDGRFNEYVGGYSDWLRQRNKAPTPATPAKPAAVEPPRERIAKKRSYKDQRELDALPAKIEQLESERDALAAQMNSPQFYTQPNDTIARARARLPELEQEIRQAYARWETLE